MERKELLEQVRRAASPEELLTLARENGLELTPESARDIFTQLHKTGELADKELENVSGGDSGESGDGKKYDSSGRLIVPVLKSCGYWEPEFPGYGLNRCFTCAFCVNENSQLACAHPSNHK